MKPLLLVGLFLTPGAYGACPDAWFNGAIRDCCSTTGYCQSSSCTVFGYKNSARTNCHTSGSDRNCIGSVCNYFNPKCIPTVSTSTLSVDVQVASTQAHCYGYVKCADGSQNCEGYGRLCLEDGSSSNFKICGDDVCPNLPDGTCPPLNACDKNYYWDGQQCRPDKCAGVSCSKEHEHCNHATGSCDCDDGWERIAGTCQVDKCAGVSCSDKEHCNSATGTCDCNDGYERSGSECVVDKCLGVVCTVEHQHCNSATGTCTCDAGYFNDNDGDCEENKCLGVTCSEDKHEHCNMKTGDCHCDNGYERVGSDCLADKCLGVVCQEHQHCNSLTGQCACDNGYINDSDGDCEENICIGVICNANEHCNMATGNCNCDEGYERVGEGCLEPCPLGSYRRADYQCQVCNECLTPNSIWDEDDKKCECLEGYTLNPTTGACDQIPPYPCIVNGEANLVKRKHGKSEDIIVGKVAIAYVGATNTFTVSYAITNPAFPDLKFKKVWPRLQSRAPKDHSNPRFDSKWLKEYSKETASATYVEFTGIQVPDFLCSVAPDVKNLYLSTQLQFWEPNDSGKYRAANGFVDDGDVKTGRDRRDFRVVVQCVLDAAHCTACAGQCLGAGQHCVWNVDGDFSCQCDDGFVENDAGLCVPEDACSFNNETCPENSYCQDLKPGARCKCNPGFHERKHPKDGSMQCVRKCMMNGGTSLKVTGGGFGGKVDIILNDFSDLSGTQYALIYTLNAGQIKSLYFQTGKNRAEKHIPALFQNSIVLGTTSNTLRYPADPNQWLTLDSPIDCSAGTDNVFHISTHLGIINSGAGYKAWGKGKKTDDANAMDFEFRIKCHANCPAAANCQGCHDKAECIWDHGSADDNKYKCKCYPGFSGNGTACNDIDECALGVATVCGANSACTNTAGSYTCACLTKTYYDAVLGCSTSTTLRAAPEDVNVFVESSDQLYCPTPSWVWIAIGVMSTVLVILLALVIIQRARQHTTSMLHYDMAEPRGEGPVPVPSTASCGFVSPSTLRRRPEGHTPKTSGRTPTAQYDPLSQQE